MSKVILITGCSTGIGHDLVNRLSQAGYAVVASARNVDTLKGLSAALKLPLDVTQPESVQQAVTDTLKQFGQIDVLINNAGYSMPGALEEVTDDQTQQVFDVNVFGVLRMIRAVLPAMRRQSRGRIINISSIVGKLSMPGNGTYAGTKFALEALSDALRAELLPFGIQVVVVEPGAIRTNFDQTAQAKASGILSNPASPYRILYKQSEQFAVGMHQHEPGPEAVTTVIEQIIRATHPRTRYLVSIPFSGRLVIALRDFVWDMVLKQLFKVDQTEFQS